MTLLAKQPSQRDREVVVTFRLPGGLGARSAAIVGEFNGWSATATPMQRTYGGSLVASLVLERGRRYRFRYLV